MTYAASFPLYAVAGSTIDLTDVMNGLFSGTGIHSCYFYNGINDPTQGWWRNVQIETTLQLDGVSVQSSFVDLDTPGRLTMTVGTDVWSGLFVQVSYSAGEGTFGASGFWLPIIPAVYSDPTPAVINGQDVVAAAYHLLSEVGATISPNGCHTIAATIAAMAGAPLPDASWSTIPSENVDGGYWTVVHRGDQTPVNNWTALLQPGDIVRYDYADPSEPQHTFVVLEVDGAYVRTIDNWGAELNDHWTNFQHWANPAAVTIYRITEAINTFWGHDHDDAFIGSPKADRMLGRSGNDWLNSGLGADDLDGGAGNDTLDGGVGDDRMQGGSGDDVYVVDSHGDQVIETVGAGTDSIRTSLTAFSLMAHPDIEHLAGTSGANHSLTGNGSNNRISTTSGADTLDGSAGADTLIGGQGHDSYLVDSYADQVTEIWDGGTDTIRTSLSSYSIFSQTLIENLTGTRATGHVLTGNGLANVITGHMGHDRLVGGAGNDTLQGSAGQDTLEGGSGSNSLAGGSGDDTYVVSSFADTLSEAAGGGTDTVQTALGAYSIFSKAHIENITSTTAASVTLTGNSLHNGLTGTNAGHDTLLGSGGNDTLLGLGGHDRLDGGSGQDVMIGGQGNDTYLVDSFSDVVTEQAGGGTDTIVTSTWAYSIFTRTHIENLTGTHGQGTTLTGNSAANRITAGQGHDSLLGGAGHDTLDGGANSDTLDGGSGADVFQFSAAIGGGTLDHVRDFDPAEDMIHLLASVFAGIGPKGGLAAAAFHIGTAASTAAHRVIYNAATGDLFHDADGAGGAGQIRFARLDGLPGLTAADLLVI